MIGGAGLALLVAAACVAARAEAATSAAERCARDGLGTALGSFVVETADAIARCAMDEGHRDGCLTDALAEVASAAPTRSYRGALRRLSDRLAGAVAVACAGDDGRPYTADDVMPQELDGDGTRSLTRPGIGMHITKQESCIPLEPVDRWMRRPVLERLLASAQCLGLSRAVAIARQAFVLPTPVIQRTSYEIVPAPIVYDGAVDLAPGGPDAVEATAIPASASAPPAGVGLCADDRSRQCAVAPGIGSVERPEYCPGPTAVCSELTGPDGITAADVPRASLARGISTFTFSDVDPDDPGDTRVEYRCAVEGVRDRSGALVTSRFAGRCHGGPCDGAACESDVECDTQLPPRYVCFDGDEYVCRVDVVRSSNGDGSPACSDCLIALVSGEAGAGCGRREQALCIASRCVGGTRDGQSCSVSARLDCPGGGICRGLGEFMTLTGDEVGFYNPWLGGMGYMLCPFQVRWDLPLNLLDGAGWVGLYANGDPTHFCLPAGSRTHVPSVYIHEPGPFGANAILPVTVFTRPSPTSDVDIPAGDIAVPLPSVMTGQYFHTGIGPIIGVGGVGAPRGGPGRMEPVYVNAPPLIGDPPALSPRELWQPAAITPPRTMRVAPPSLDHGGPPVPPHAPALVLRRGGGENPEAKARCLREGIQAALPTFVRALQRCDAGAFAECGAEADGTGASRDALAAARESFRARIAAACAGADRIPGTADDVPPESLDPGARSGARFRPWGAELSGVLEPTLLVRPPGAQPIATRMQAVLEENCVSTGSPEAWLRRPPLDRLLDTAECMAFAAVTRNAPRAELVKLEITTPPIVYDGGADQLPAGAPDGINESVAIPQSSGCPLPGVGTCAGDPQVRCAMAPGAGTDPENRDCGPVGPCVERLTGPDGITAADLPHSWLGSGRFLYELRDSERGSTAQYACLVDGVRDASGALVTTDPSGVCEGGPHAGAACADSADCDTQGPARFRCLSGDEYVCEVQELVGSNRDGEPPCARPCLAAEIFGTPGKGCGTGGTAFCVISRCSGGDRDGQACDEGGTVGCPGGFCAGLGEEVTLTGDEAGFFVPKAAGTGYFLCPFQFRHDTPFDLTSGTGWGEAEITDAPLFACRPRGTPVQVKGGYVHEPAATNDLSLIGLYTAASTGRSGDTPCPDINVPFPAATSGLPLRMATGPIIGTAGAVMP